MRYGASLGCSPRLGLPCRFALRLKAGVKLLFAPPDRRGGLRYRAPLFRRKLRSPSLATFGRAKEPECAADQIPGGLALRRRLSRDGLYEEGSEAVDLFRV